MSRVPEKGKPNFSNLDDKRLREYREVVNEMIGAFSDFPEEKKVLKQVWKKISDECLDRSDERPETVPETKVARHLPKTFKRSKALKTSS